MIWIFGKYRKEVHGRKKKQDSLPAQWLDDLNLANVSSGVLYFEGIIILSLAKMVFSS